VGRRFDNIIATCESDSKRSCLLLSKAFWKAVTWYQLSVPFCVWDFRRVTPKVFANFSPGLSFGNPGDKTGDCFCRNPEGIATVCARRAPPFQGCAFPSMTFGIPGLPKLNPGLKLANTFGVTLLGSGEQCDGSKPP
jgi:hypothetical protein